MRYWLLTALLIFSLMPIMAQESTPEATPESTPPAEPEMTLVPFTLVSPSISGLRPADWREASPGVYLREDGQNTTYLVHLSEPDSTREELLPSLLESIGQDALPDESELVSGEAFDWEVYQMFYIPEGFEEEFSVFIAFAETETAVHVILLQTPIDEADMLREMVFDPALENYGLPLSEIYAGLGLIPLEAVTVSDFDLQTAIPAEWQEVNPGSFVRAHFQGDITTLLIQTSPDLSAEEFGVLLLERLGIATEFPEQSEMFETEYLTWTLYTFEVDAEGQLLTFQFALAEDDTYAYLAVLLSTAEEADVLEENLFLPILQATYRASAVPES